jgi:ATP-dependent Lhr-like helicase
MPAQEPYLPIAGTPAGDGLPAPASLWFRQRFAAPTPIQRRAWPAVVSGSHVLISAPTGTGKTLAALLPLLGRLVVEPPSPGLRLTGLYVAPLKALVNDVGRTLGTLMQELAALVPTTEVPAVALRTADSSPAERRALRRAPPAVLLTTPESLAVLLSQGPLQSVFAGLQWILVDEVHALAPRKRGADLALSLERLTALAGGRVQRLGLSATATPLAEAAAWLAGVGRDCAIAHVAAPAELHVHIAPLDGDRFLASLVRHVIPEVEANRSTLVFTNTRRLAEQLAWALRRTLPGWEDRIAVHHSSLAAGRRQQVEQAFQAGRLRVVVSSTSLELGIDIGPVDLVVLVHPPGDVIRLLQRVGRAGHGPGRVRRGLVLTATAAELLEAAVTAASGLAQQCEPLHVPDHPLDVLCQQIAGMACAGVCSAEEAFQLAQKAGPFRNLSRTDLDDCLRYLLGRGADGRPWLPARLEGTPECFRIRDGGTTRLLRRNLGTILDDPESEVLEIREDTDAPDTLGRVAQAFADRLRPGDRFLLDGRCLEVRHCGPGEVVVQETPGRAGVPRWGGDGWPLSTELARRLFLLRVQAAEALRDGPHALAALLRREYGLDGDAAGQVVAYFQRQECVSEVPDGAAVLVELVAGETVTACYWHTPLNRLANDALTRVATFRLARDWGHSAHSTVADLGFALFLRGGLPQRPGVEAPAGVLRLLLEPAGFEADLEMALESGDTLRQRFARIAQTGLMLLRQPLGGPRRVGGADWAARQLFDQVRAHDVDFVLLRQARREVRAECCDGAAAVAYARDIAGRPLRCRWLPYASPFAENWSQQAEGAAASAETPAEALRRLHETLWREAPDARP